MGEGKGVPVVNIVIGKPFTKYFFINISRSKCDLFVFCDNKEYNALAKSFLV